MSENFDWELVNRSVNKERTQYEYHTHKHLFEKVAFDRFKPMNGGSGQLWELRAGDDGKDYLFALYDEAEDLTATSSKEWQAKADADGKNITLSYKQTPVYRLPVADEGMDTEKVNKFASYIEKRAESKDFVDQLLNSMSESRRAAVKKLMGE